MNEEKEAGLGWADRADLSQAFFAMPIIITQHISLSHSTHSGYYTVRLHLNHSIIFVIFLLPDF